MHEKQSGGEPRAKAVRQAMIKTYGRLAMDGNGMPIVMTETEIFNWLKRHWSTVPRRLLCPPQQLWPSSDQRKQRHSCR